MALEIVLVDAAEQSVEKEMSCQERADIFGDENGANSFRKFLRWDYFMQPQNVSHFTRTGKSIFGFVSV